ncbi:putative lipoprotein [Myxococcus xanthus DK 1622]|uniref:Lipoprotein n=1 Tax=Myxococcus xanthus (strain DK1622) TaxID=246197 RepID=Q1DC27_MYXXD|nr:TIGR02269 family lipoprotein [Myxococcus xanthus]ABF86103.1 putative lipoprotein [Myxococcus xanthus DK 1622]NOJ51874.1 TIGR02269 family lipoprotein [Myxococcus xanthus]QPM81174.1 TIGR02269 family lipoprotein [Myxococcus xanthus]QVW70233.1 TIGR02269 family lipoprotein [Myxococcus xanthus DZ2]UEO03637.1 TIGR02269 family lipoprotein [Myxococcus xanthus DZ2]
MSPERPILLRTLASTLRLLVLSCLLVACASAPPTPDPPRGIAELEYAELCEATEAAPCVSLACDEGWCAFFLCEDVAPRVEPALMPVARPPLRRGWGVRLGIRNGAQPVITFPWRPHVQVRPVYQLPAGRYVRHHIFPQAPDLALYFQRAGIKIHDFTLVIPEHVHRYIHGGGPRGGRWNDAWAQFIKAHPHPPRPDVIYRHAGDLIFRFELTGKVMPYYKR